MTVDEIKDDKRNAIAMGPFGSNIKSDNFVPNGVPVIRGNNLVDYIFNEEEFVYLKAKKANSLKASLCYSGDLIFTHRGTIGQVGLIPNNSKFKRYIVSQSGMKLSCNSELVDNEFVFLFFKTKMGQHLLLRNSSQTGVPSIAKPTTSLKEIPIPIPPLAEAKRIKDTIFCIQKKIHNLQHQNQTLETIAQTLFKQWFVDFNFPDETGKPYKGNGGEMVGSELGEIPLGWEIKKLGRCLNILIDNRGKTPKFVENGIPALSAKFVKNGNLINRDKFNFVPYDLFNQSEKLLIDDIIMTSEAPLGELYYVSENTKYYPAQRVFAMRADRKIILPSYLYFWLDSFVGQYLIKRRGSGSTVQGIKQSELKECEVIVPGCKIMDLANSYLKAILLKKEKNETQIQTLTKTRDTLLPKLMSGQIRIKD